MFLSEAVSLLVHATVLRWTGPSLFDAITYIMSRSIRGKSLSLILCCLHFIYLLVLTRELFQIREETLQYSSSHITMLPCERGRSCYYWPVQVRTNLFCFVYSDFSTFAVIVYDNILWLTGLYPKLWGSMYWRWFQPVLVVLGKKLLPECELDCFYFNVYI